MPGPDDGDRVQLDRCEPAPAWVSGPTGALPPGTPDDCPAAVGDDTIRPAIQDQQFKPPSPTRLGWRSPGFLDRGTLAAWLAPWYNAVLKGRSECAELAKQSRILMHKRPSMEQAMNGTTDIRPLIPESSTSESTTVEVVMNDMRDNMLIIPDYRRDSDQWEEPTKSLLVESVINNLSIPAFFFEVSVKAGLERFAFGLRTETIHIEGHDRGRRRQRIRRYLPCVPIR